MHKDFPIVVNRSRLDSGTSAARSGGSSGCSVSRNLVVIFIVLDALYFRWTSIIDMIHPNKASSSDNYNMKCMNDRLISIEFIPDSYVLAIPYFPNFYGLLFQVGR